jgi:hypothetical protein
LPEDLNQDEIVSRYLEIYLLDKGCAIPKPFDVSHYFLLPIAVQSWLAFNPD